MNATQVWLNSYAAPRRAMEALAEWQTPRNGAWYVAARGVLLGILGRILYIPLAAVFVRT